jgi:peptidoglycan/xylan/chitin deacetylase (PgdA/CDA1 family)
MKLTKTRVAILIFTLLASSASYAIGRGGIDVGRAIVESRCSAGAFIAHAKSPSAVQADVHSDAAVTLPNNSGQSAAGDFADIPLAPANLVSNGDIEAFTGAKPKGWDSNAVGKNSSRFSTVAGYNSNIALRIDVSSYTNGTADWFGSNLAVTPGAYYQFQDHYRSSVSTRAVLMLKDNTGKAQFVNLASVPASDQWAAYTQRFFVPSNVSTIMISHPLDRTGWLETDTYNLQLATAPAFSEAMVSLTFDDGWRSIHDNALPLMDKYSIVSTQYLVSGFLGGYKEYMKPSQVYDFTKNGHEIASHTFDHADLTQVNDAQLGRELTLPHAGLSKCFGSVTDFAPPFGSNNQRTITAEKGVYQTSRSTEVGFNSPDTLDPYQLKVQNVRVDTSPEQIQAWLDTAKINHVWLILVYHQVLNGGGEYSRTPADFETDLQSIKASGVAVETIHNAYAATQK